MRAVPGQRDEQDRCLGPMTFSHRNIGCARCGRPRREHGRGSEHTFQASMGNAMAAARQKIAEAGGTRFTDLRVKKEKKKP